MSVLEHKRASQWTDEGTYKKPTGDDNVRVPRLEVDDAATYVDKDGSNNMTLTDAVTGTKTLAQLGGGGTPADTVAAETSFGISSGAGAASSYSRGDHTHGSPTDPVTTHVAASDPHTGYRLESADHSHQSTGLQGGQLDHGLALTGLTDDDHTQYFLVDGTRALTGDVTLGAYKLKTTTTMLKESGAGFVIRNLADTEPYSLTANAIYASVFQAVSDDSYFYAKNADAAYVVLLARDTGVGQVEVARMVGAADPYFQATLPLRLLPIATASLPGTPVEGMITWDDTLNRIVVFNGTVWLPVVSTADVDDTPVDGATTDPISSNWAFDHVAAADPHTGYQKESEKGAASGYASLSAATLVTENPVNATATPTASKIVIADGGGKVDGWVSASSTTVPGITEAAIASEVDTGTDTARAVTPNALAGSLLGIRYAQEICYDFTTSVAVGDGKGYLHIPPGLNGMNLVYVHARVITAGTTNTTDIQIANVTDTTDMLSTKLTIDSAETGSDTAAIPAVIDTTKDDVATNDLLRIDVDAISTTAPKGLIVTLGFQLP